MNNKFFAALASATMAFTASGSIAVFADDFVEESNIVKPDGDIKPIPTEVVWNKENFGDLVDQYKVTVHGKPADLDEGEVVTTKQLENVTYIELKNDAAKKVEVKGLKYFPNLTSVVFNGAQVVNSTLDFSTNTKLENLYVYSAKDLTEIVLPNPTVKDEEEFYSLKTLVLENTKLTSVDLSAQEELETAHVTKNKNLKEIVVRTGTLKNPVKYTTLNFSGNALETINLDRTDIHTLVLSNNHIGALDLSKTKAYSADLSGQTFYVSETLENVNLEDVFAGFDVDAVKEGKPLFDKKTGVLTLGTDKTTYTYVVNFDGAQVLPEMDVTLEAANPMNRLYNPNSGEHFYTADIKEKEALVALGWNDEGYGWVAPKSEAGHAVYRLYNPNAGDHHYTMSAEERDTLVAYGWKDEKTGWKSVDDVKSLANPTGVEVYRQYNPYANGAGSHNYTTDKAENDFLVSLGWTPEGIAWTALQ